MTAWFPQHKFVMSCLRGPFSIAACSPGETRAPAKRLWFPSLGRIPADDMTTTLPQCTTRFPGNIFWANSKLHCLPDGSLSFCAPLAPSRWVPPNKKNELPP